MRDHIEEDVEAGLDGPIDGEQMGDIFQIGDNFAIAIEESNNEGVNFYIL